MADTWSDTIGKRSSRVDEKFKGTNWPTFRLELQTVLVHLRCDVIKDRKPNPADPADATTPAGIVAAKKVATWVQQNKDAMAAIRGNTDKSFYGNVWRANHTTALQIWDYLQEVFRYTGQC